MSFFEFIFKGSFSFVAISIQEEQTLGKYPWHFCDLKLWKEGQKMSNQMLPPHKILIQKTIIRRKKINALQDNVTKMLSKIKSRTSPDGTHCWLISMCPSAALDSKWVLSLLRSCNSYCTIYYIIVLILNMKKRNSNNRRITHEFNQIFKCTGRMAHTVYPIVSSSIHLFML